MGVQLGVNPAPVPLETRTNETVGGGEYTASEITESTLKTALKMEELGFQIN
jgi:hypothetical protein